MNNKIKSTRKACVVCSGGMSSIILWFTYRNHSKHCISGSNEYIWCINGDGSVAYNRKFTDCGNDYPIVGFLTETFQIEAVIYIWNYVFCCRNGSSNFFSQFCLFVAGKIDSGNWNRSWCTNRILYYSGTDSI